MTSSTASASSADDDDDDDDDGATDAAAATLVSITSESPISAPRGKGKPLTKSRSESQKGQLKTANNRSKIAAKMTIAKSPKPTRRLQAGLRNLGQTCYMNAVLQCLAHIVSFRRAMESLTEPGGWLDEAMKGTSDSDSDDVASCADGDGDDSRGGGGDGNGNSNGGTIRYSIDGFLIVR